MTLVGQYYDANGLLSRFNQWAGRPDKITNASAVDAVPDDVKWQCMADGEQYTISRLSAIFAKVMYGAPAQLITTDGGYTYGYGNDVNGVPLFPLGRTQIFPTSLSCLPGFALQPGVDYLDEGVRIRCCNNVPLVGPLYWYGLAPAGQLSPTNAPVLQPPPANVLSVIKAVAVFAESGNIRNAALSDRMTLRYEREFGPTCTEIRKHLRGSGPGGRLLTPWAAAYGSSLSSSFAY